VIISRFNLQQLVIVATRGPWGNLTAATFDFLEGSVGGIIAEPLNTWSNLAYILVGLILLYSHRNDRWTPVKYFAYASIAVGISSGLYHASLCFVFQAMDLGSMYLISLLMLTLNLRRLGVIHRGEIYWTYWGLFVFSIAILLVFQKFGRFMFNIQLFLALTMEGYLYSRDKSYKLSPLLTAIGISMGALIFWILDWKEIISNPANHHFQGHAMWHVLTAISFFYLYKFYDQFNLLSARRQILRFRRE